MTVSRTKYRSVCFDFDGTLIDSCEAKVKVFERFADEYGSRQTLARLSGDYTDRFDLMKAFFEAENIVSPSAQLLARWSDMIDEHVLDCPLIDGADNLLELLRISGVHLTLASLTPEPSLKRIIRSAGLDRYFDGVYGSSTSKERVLLGLKYKFRDSVAMVGDGLGDRNAAMTAGVDFFQVGTRNSGEQHFHVYNLQELATKLV